MWHHNKVYDNFHGPTKKSTFGTFPTYIHAFKHHNYFHVDLSVGVEHFILKYPREWSKFECKIISKS